MRAHQRFPVFLAARPLTLWAVAVALLAVLPQAVGHRKPWPPVQAALFSGPQPALAAQPAHRRHGPAHPAAAHPAATHPAAGHPAAAQSAVGEAAPLRSAAAAGIPRKWAQALGGGSSGGGPAGASAPAARSVRSVATDTAVGRQGWGAGSSTLGETRYLTLNPGDTLDLSALLPEWEAQGALRGLQIDQEPELFARLAGRPELQALRSGFCRLRVSQKAGTEALYAFVSPLPSRHTGRGDLDWYRTQYATGMANCGPALVSMAILWAKGTEVPVQAVRREIGYPYENGVTSFENLQSCLESHGVHARARIVTAPQEMMRLVDLDRLVFVLIFTGTISKAAGDPAVDLFGRYYDDAMGHYVLIKGYSEDGHYFAVYDPFPSDWAGNNRRYADGVSMIGRNRYYAAAELFAALRTPQVLEIRRD